MLWQKAWEIPYRIDQKGQLDASTLAAMEEPDLQRLLESLPVKPRYGCANGARTLSDAAHLVMRFDASGDASAIWDGVSPLEVQKRLESVYGIGPGIAHMVIRILRDDWEKFRGQEREIDVKPDVHVMRVFKRTGLTPTENERKAVEAARELNPSFPGELDWPAWDIGINWCRPTNPLCSDCPLTAVCPKHIYTPLEAYLIERTPLVVWWDKGINHLHLYPATPEAIAALEYLKSDHVEIPTPVESPSPGILDHRGRVGRIRNRHELAGAVYRIPPFASITVIHDLRRFLREHSESAAETGQSTLRLAREDDAEQIAAIYAPYVNDTAVSFADRAPTAEEYRWRIRTTTARLPWVVCERDGIVAGYAYASPHRVSPAYKWSVETSIYVHAEHHRTGVGRALYAALLEALRALGYHGAYAGITEPNPASVGLHEAVGFEFVGTFEEVGYKLGAWRSVIWMACRLGNDDYPPTEPRLLPDLIGTPEWDAVLAAGQARLR